MRFQKTLNLYHENGFSFQYGNPAVLNKHITVGLTYVSSRLGSAIRSNAIKQDNLFLSGSYNFRVNRTIQPLLRANVGLFRADYESAIFKDLANSSPLLSTEFGLAIPLHNRLKFESALGYNLITGDGSDSPGTLYPIFYHLSIYWNLFNHHSK
ncbi:hypothetical protein [Adhaeribacter aquaticus]|uniref:hypothetical protein n=1 Tax=Adhaeribacter aquaticus TaxID=299567 RepID=UPI0012FCB8BA|nr:hypothetical protein [Adhaeribacter aquaticus]